MENKRVNHGNIPDLFVSGRTIPEAWEKALLAVYDNGIEIPTQYDTPGDLPSLDATVMVEVLEPLEEPRIHKNFPGGPQELEIYRQEVLNGIHDHWVKPKEGKWTYTYHQRLFAYQPSDDLKNPDAILRKKPSGCGEHRLVKPVNQIEDIIDYLVEVPYSRRAQGITWMPTADPQTEDPPCLQRVWCRILYDEEGNPVLNMNTDWRSRDLYKAGFMNIFAITDLQKWMAEQIGERMSKKEEKKITVKVGRYSDKSDSLHIYGKYRDEKFEAEIAKMKSSHYSERVWNSDIFEPMFREVKENLKKDPDYYAKGSE